MMLFKIEFFLNFEIWVTSYHIFRHYTSLFAKAVLIYRMLVYIIMCENLWLFCKVAMTI